MTARQTSRSGPSSTRIALITGASLAWNPRAAKEATTLARAGYDVVVYGASGNRAIFEGDRALARQRGFAFESVIGSAPNETGQHGRRSWRRLRSRMGQEAFRILGIQNRWQLGPCGTDLLRHARSSGAHYFIVHLEQSMWVGQRLMLAGERVGLDMEDWFSEDLLPAARKQRPVGLLRELEQQLLRRGAHASCPSRAMSAALAAEFDCAAPAAIYNCFPWSDRGDIDGGFKDRRDRSIPSIHWCSQTLGPGRGLEDLLGALPQVRHGLEVHLRGQCTAGFEAWLRARVPERWRHCVHVHAAVPHDELLSRIAEHDIGFAGEMKYCRNKELTVSNKILHYLLAGLAVVASDTAGQLEVAGAAPEAVLVYPSGEPAALAQQLNVLLTSQASLQNARRAALEAAEQTFCWERQEGALLDVIACALERRSRGIGPQ